MTGQPAGLEQRSLAVADSAGAVRDDLELQPGTAGQAHLGAQAEQPRPVQVFHAPPIERFADVQPVGITATAAQPDTAGQPVDPAAD